MAIIFIFVHIILKVQISLVMLYLLMDEDDFTVLKFYFFIS